MDKYEYKVKIEQIEKMADKKDFVTAAKIADGIDWRKVKSASTLSMIADVYEETGRLEECYELLNMVYDRSPIGRRIVYHMAEVAIKMHNFEEAIELYKEFVKIAPHDLNRYILKYQIYRERGSAVTDQITILEEFKTHEYDERWAYELACLYEEAGMIDHCIEECDELILWFSEGEYVIKAMELKMKYQELTASQQEKYEHRFDYLEAAEELETEEEEVAAEEEETSESTAAETDDTKEEPVKSEPPVSEESDNSRHEKAEEEDTLHVSEINLNKFSTINLQKELAKNLQEILAQAEEEEQPAEGDTQEFLPVKTVVIEEAVEEEAEEAVAEETEAVWEEADTVQSTVEEEEHIVKEEEETPAETEEQPAKPEKLSETEELQVEILKYMTVSQQPKMEELLRTEEDGQMTLVMSEENPLEKQITGQMTIGEILEAWEEKKRQVREQIEAAEAKKPAVLFETGEITGLLEDFIPKTPKEIVTEVPEPEISEEEIEKIEEAENSESEEAAEEEVQVTEEPEEMEEAETVEESEVTAHQEEIPEEMELEDDLPQDLELEEALEAFVEEPVEVPEKETEKEAVPEEEPEKEAVEEQPEIGENTASMIDAIERALALEIEPLETSGTYLTEEQEKIFAYFTSVKGMKKQLIALLNEDCDYAGKEDSKEGNLVITGYPGNGKTTLAIDIVKAIQKQRKVKGAKLAKVSGDGFNKKNPQEVISKLGGGALIIERAGSLKDEVVELLSEAMEGLTGGLLVILEDDISEIERLLGKHQGFAAKFNRSVNIPIFSNDELVAFGKSYAEEKEYFFDDMAVLALYDSIGVRQTSEHVVNITEVKEFIDDAIAHAERKSKGFFVRLSKKRIDEYGNKLLLEEDFNY